jgi:hypothetical protein
MEENDIYAFCDIFRQINPEEKRRLERHRRRWEDNIEGILGKLDGKLWIGYAWFRIGTSCMLL